MSENTIETPAYSDFWLNKEALYQYIPKGENNDSFSMDLIQLAAFRRIVSNFVFILTHMDIPVQFCTQEKSTLNFTDGKMVFLSASIRRKADFDWSVGVALHEASHILLTDFDVMKSTFSRIPIPIPQSLKKKCKEKNLSEEHIAYLCKWVWNYVEDRYIDSYIFKEAPGYRGYYKSMYEKFWNSEVNSKGLKSKAFRVPNMLSYEFRVINLTNPDTDLDALKGLREIAELIDIHNIFRLTTSVERMDLSYKVAEIIVDNLAKQEKEKDPNTANSTVKKVHDKLQSGSGGLGEAKKQAKKEKKEQEKGGKGKPEKSDDGEPTKPEKSDDGDLTDEELKNRIDGENKEKECSPTDAGDIKEFSKDELDELAEYFNQQRNILDHSYDGVKEGVTSNQKAILDAIEKAGIVLVPVGYGLSGDYTQAAVDCIVVKKMTRQLMESGQKTFPLATNWNGRLDNPPATTDNAVAKGFVLGKLLGKKLQIRGEENAIKYIRKPSGKIERRLLAEIGVGSENIFTKMRLERYNKARLHISVDSSGSMATDSKWCPTMTCVVAICVAASMVENLDVSVSFRSTISTDRGTDLPYIVLAYDSRTDKISKVRQLFPYLRANGATPEGLAFEAIAEEFIIGKKTTEQDHYFLNLSDGEPAYSVRADTNKYGVSFSYTGEPGALHTKVQVDRIRAQGVKVLSYFIDGGYTPSIYSGLNFNSTAVDKMRQLTLNQLFDIMYGRDGKFIDVQSVTDIAQTINKLFLSKV